MTRPLASLTQRARAAVSGTVPEEPVINKQSGLLFEKRLIEKHVQVSAWPGYAPSFVCFGAKLQALKLVTGA